MKNFMRLTSMLCIGSLIFSGCAKDGPVGPAGQTGATGAQGNANVQSGTYTNLAFAFVAANNDYELYINDPAITQTALDQGAVLVYFQATTNTSGWTMLPGTFNNIAINVSFGLGQVEVTDGTMPSGLFNFRIVVIPPFIMHAHPDLNTKDFNAVQKMFNLKN